MMRSLIERQAEVNKRKQIEREAQIAYEAKLVRDLMAREQTDELNRQADLKKRDLRRSELADRYATTIIPKIEAKESEAIKLTLVNLRRK